MHKVNLTPLPFCQMSSSLKSSSVTATQERHTQLEGSVTQRLKWAAGANPKLASIVTNFEEGLQKKNDVVKVSGWKLWSSCVQSPVFSIMIYLMFIFNYDLR